MEVTTVAILGGSGFVGKHLCHTLAAEGYRVRVATRDRERAKEQLILLPTVELASVDIHDPAKLAAFVRSATVSGLSSAVIWKASHSVAASRPGGAPERASAGRVAIARL